jgi:phenylacetate-CoA ligase
MSLFWDKNIECLDRDSMKKLQSERLIATVKRVYDNVPYYANKMKAAGITPEDIKGIDDLHLLPFTYKTDLRENYPFGTFAVPMQKVVRVHASSGTTGKQTVVGYTENDIKTWADCMARAFTSAGVTDKDVIHIAYGYGLFTGGLGIHYGAERVGATVVPVSGGNTKRQIQLMLDFEATVLCCTPSYALFLADEMNRMGVKKEELKLKVGIFGAEPWTEEMRQQLIKRLGIEASDIYGLSEIMGPGVAIDCPAHSGLHISADSFIPEIIDPDTGEVLPEGSQGELVFTCITKEALPLIRYRTRDLSSLNYTTCACGRTTPRMQKVTGRTDDMLVIRGVNVFPSQIESVLLQFDEIEPHYMIYVDRKDNLDSMEIHIEMKGDLFADEVRKIEALEKRLDREIDSALGINAKVRLVEPHSIERSEGKAKRVIDRRNIF